MYNPKTGYPHRPPKKYPQKDLHGRTRIMQIWYKDFDRFQKFYVNVLGWDMIELPEAAGGKVPGSENPGLICATGPSYETYEGVVPGHMNAIVRHAEGELPKPQIMMEIHQMPEPVATTVEAAIRHGGSVAGAVDEEHGWVFNAEILDPSGNILAVWRTGPSRLWDEQPECFYDKD